jgi:hypothetical protein
LAKRTSGVVKARRRGQHGQCRGNRAGGRELKDGQKITFDIEPGRDDRESTTNLKLA